MIHDEFLQILCCPENHRPLERAGSDQLARVNQQIRAGRAYNRGGEAVRQELEEGLLQQNGTWLYPVHGGIPCLLVDEAIDLEAVPDDRSPLAKEADDG